MSEAGRKRGFTAFLGTLVATVLVPLLWMKALALARRHEDADPRGRMKVLAAIAVSLGIALVGTYALLGFFADARAGMYSSLDERMATAVGETEYQEQLSTIDAANKALPVIEGNLARERTALATAQATGDDAAEASAQANVTKLEDTLAKTQDQLAKATARKATLEPNHAQYARIKAAALDQDDAEVRRLVTTGPDYKDRDERMELAFAVKDKAVDDMRLFAWLFFWPSLAGAFFAPMAFALGSILAKAYEPSDTVGYKPYPGGAAGLFLLFGAFGVPSIPFAAWTFHDALGRSQEGQIAL